MNYNHHYHAGNFADCLKHVILFAVLAYFRERNKPFLAVDAFAGAGLYDLASLEPQKTGEKDEGISCWFKNPPQSALVRGFFQRFHQLSGSGKEVSFLPWIAHVFYPWANRWRTLPFDGNPSGHLHQVAQQASIYKRLGMSLNKMGMPPRSHGFLPQKNVPFC